MNNEMTTLWPGTWNIASKWRAVSALRIPGQKRHYGAYTT